MNEHSPVVAAVSDGDGAYAPAPLWQRIFAADYLHRPRLFRYGLALVLVSVSLVLRLLLDPMIGDRAPYIFYFPAILVTSVLGGFGPALLATVASAGLVLYQLGAPGGLDQPDLLNTLAYAVVGVAISYPGGPGARSPSEVDPGHRAGCYDRHRRGWHNALVQRRGRKCSDPKANPRCYCDLDMDGSSVPPRAGR